MTTARRFSATLGIIAFVFVAGFAVWQGNDLDRALLRALVALVMFAALGYVTGLVGSAIVNDCADGEVRRKARAEEMKRKRAQSQRSTRERREDEEGPANAGAAAGAAKPS